MMSARQQLLQITPSTPDRTVATLIAEALLESDARPYKFSINHDIRPPKCLACPVGYDWSVKDRVGIIGEKREAARRWIIHACLEGYKVSQESGRELLTSSIEIARERAKRHQTPRSDDDDDIPF